jgi:endo-beta-N-acetylglucosaminidase D
MDAILYAGDALGPTNIAQNTAETRAAGWTQVILTHLHVQKTELDFNDASFIQNGNIVPQFAQWADSLQQLKSGGSIQKIYLSLGGPGVHDYRTIQSIFKPFGGGYAGSVLETNLTALRAKFPAIDGIELNIQEEDQMNSYPYFAQLCTTLTKLGFEVSYAPYGVATSRPFTWYITSMQQVRQEQGAITKFNLQNFSPSGCAPTNVWLDAIAAEATGFDTTNFLTLGSNARNTTDGGKTWNGSCPNTVKDFISQNSEANPFSIGGGNIWNFDHIQQTSIGAGDCSGPATMADYVNAIKEGIGPAPRIKSINTISDLRGWQSQLEGANISRVKLKPRVVLPPDTKLSMAGFDMGEFQYDPFFDAWSQGASGSISTRTAANVYNFSYWQFVDIIYYFGHNFVTIPPVVWTNCAHKNGVLCLGTVNMDALTSDEVQNFLTSAPANPTPGALYKGEAIKLLQALCANFGFDGFIFNCEKYGSYLRTLPGCVQGMQEMLAAFNTAEVKSIWYDSPMSSANGRYDNKLTQEAYPYFKAASYFQSNYNWGTFDGATKNYPQESFAVLQNNDPNNALANRERMFQGLYCATLDPVNGKTPPYKGNFFNSYAYLNSPGPAPEPGLPTPPQYFTSLNIYYPAWLMYDLRVNPKHKNTDQLPDRNEFHNNDEAFWNGSKAFINYPNPGPNNPVGPKQCMRHFVAPRAVISSLPFVTWFNDGEGDFYNIDGNLSANGPWNNLSDQSVLPTYRFSINGVNAQTNNTRIDHGTTKTVFTGGSSLSIDIGNTFQIQFKLFDGVFSLKPTTTFSLVLQQAYLSGHYLVLQTTAPDPIIPTLINREKLANGWTRYNYNVPQAPSDTLVLGIEFNVSAGTVGASCYIGAFSIIETSNTLPPPQNKIFNDPKVAELDFSDIYNPTSHYRVYAISATVPQLIGVVYNSVYRISYNGVPSKNIFNNNLTNITGYVVQEVNAAGQSQPVS